MALLVLQCLEKLRIPLAILMITAVVGAGAGIRAYRAGAQEDSLRESDSRAKSRPGRKVEGPRKLVTAPSAQPKDQKIAIRTENFLVTAPTLEIAERVALAAERNRKELARLWLDKELPAWSEPCPVRVTVTKQTTGSYSTFQFQDAPVLSKDPAIARKFKQSIVIRGGMVLEGPLDRIFADLLPHEMTHTILAEWRGKPLPRWADEGAAMLSESAIRRAHHEQAMEKLLTSGHPLPLRDLLAKHNYPKELATFYAQSFSLTNFLLVLAGRQKFLTFVAKGQDEGWDKAAESVYGFETVKELEREWLEFTRDRLAEKQTETPRTHDRDGGSYEPSRPPPVAVAPAQTQAGGVKIEASAKGVRVELAEVQGTAQRVFYDEATGRLQLEGSADNPATLFRKRPGKQGELIRARKILYFIKDGKCQTTGVANIDIDTP